MPALSRRLFLLSLAGTLGAACTPAVTGIRGVGTVLRPRDTQDADEASATVAPPTPSPLPSPTPTVVAPPIVPPEAVPATPPSSEGDAQARVIPIPRTPPPRTVLLPPRRLIIPTIGLDSKIIVIGTKVAPNGEIVWETAPFAVGYHKGTGLPGEPGNMVLSGHISSPREGDVFRRLPQVKVGHGIIVATDERQFLYRVVRTQVVSPKEVSVLDPTDEPTATLITCVPDGIYTDRLVVTATLV